MRLSVGALALAGGILWGAVVLLVALAHHLWPPYGSEFLEVMASLYPGYEVGGVGTAIVGGVYALVDGAIAGAVIAWLYNLAARAPRAS